MKAADICPVSALLPRSAFSFFVIRHWSFVIRLVLLTDHESRASRLRPWRFPPWLAVVSEGGCPLPLAPKQKSRRGIRAPRRLLVIAQLFSFYLFSFSAFQCYDNPSESSVGSSIAAVVMSP